MRKPLLIIAGLVLLFTAAAAQSNIWEIIGEFSKYHGQYGQALAQYGVGDTNVYIQGYSGITYSYYIKVDDAGYARLYLGRLLFPKIEIWTSEDTMNRVLASSDARAALTFAVNNGLVRIRGIGLDGMLKIAALKSALFAGAGQALGNLPGTWIQRAAGGPCGPIQYRTIPMGQTMSFIAVCAEGMTCRNGYCLRSIPPAQSGKKRPGEICIHGGECTTGNCLKIPYSGEWGSNSPATFMCSCKPFVLDTQSCLT